MNGAEPEVRSVGEQGTEKAALMRERLRRSFDATKAQGTCGQGQCIPVRRKVRAQVPSGEHAECS